MKTANTSPIADPKKWYTEELKRKDNEIEDLKKENQILIKTALKCAEKLEIQKDLNTKHKKKSIR